jgi:NAD(P)-dependent dehydrogenase (short-subunit alcohol dehydrogenase family)
VVGNIHLFNLFLPLVLKGDVKKVIAISSGMADLELTNNFKLDLGAPYSISKAALNLAVSKFHAQYSADGVLFMSVCPGMVDTGGAVNGMEASSPLTCSPLTYWQQLRNNWPVLGAWRQNLRSIRPPSRALKRLRPRFEMSWQLLTRQASKMAMAERLYPTSEKVRSGFEVAVVQFTKEAAPLVGTQAEIFRLGIEIDYM